VVIALGRVAVAVVVVVVACSAVLARQRDRSELERVRGSLLAVAVAARAPLTAEDMGGVVRMESLLLQAAGVYEGDVVADELRHPGALAAALARPAVYVRAAQDQARTPMGITTAAAASMKDPFLVCLLEPPTARTEKALSATVHDVYSGGAEPHSRNVRRLREAEEGLPFLTALWEENIHLARTSGELDALRAQFDRAPIEAAKRAVRADYFLYAIDEDGDRGGATELDGERPHAVRVGLVELKTARVVLRMRKRVDPSWVSTGRRALYASGFDGCALAYDVRESITR
jgi:hypothetical protein